MSLKKFFQKINKSPRKAEILSLSGITAAFLSLTLPTLASASIWFDEAFSAYIIRHDFSKIWHFTSVDVHPPLYYFALKIWSLVFGNSDFALRSMSVLFAILTIWATFYLIKRIFGLKSAVITTVLIAISPMMVRYAQEMRMYTMVAFFSIITIRSFYEIYIAENSAKDKRHWKIALVISAALGIWTQYLSGLTMVALWIWRATTIKKPTKFCLKKFSQEFFSQGWFKINLAIILLFLPWIPFFLIQAATVKSGFWIKDLSFNTLPDYISNLFTFVNSGDLNGWWCLAIFIAIYLAYILARKLSPKAKNKFKFIWAMAWLPVAVLFLASMPPAKSIFVDRYAFPAMIMAIAAIGVLLELSWNSHNKLAIALTILCVGLLTYGNFEIDRQRGFSKTSNSTTQTRQIIDRIKAQSSENEPIITTSGYFYYEVAQYADQKTKVWFTDWTQDYKIGSLKMLEADSDHKIKDISEFSKNYSTIWTVYNYGETSKQPLDPSWKLEKQETYKDPLTGNDHYLIQKFSIQK